MQSAVVQRTHANALILSGQTADAIPLIKKSLDESKLAANKLEQLKKLIYQQVINGGR
jgi:hypothetical protein